jgi:hypothetical protein
VKYDVGAVEGRAKCLGVENVGLDVLDVEAVERVGAPHVGGAYLHPGVEQCSDEVGSDEPIRSGDGGTGHLVPPLGSGRIGARRRRARRRCRPYRSNVGRQIERWPSWADNSVAAREAALPAPQRQQCCAEPGVVPGSGGNVCQFVTDDPCIPVLAVDDPHDPGAIGTAGGRERGCAGSAFDVHLDGCRGERVGPPVRTDDGVDVGPKVGEASVAPWRKRRRGLIFCGVNPSGLLVDDRVCRRGATCHLDNVLGAGLRRPPNSAWLPARTPALAPDAEPPEVT